MEIEYVKEARPALEESVRCSVWAQTHSRSVDHIMNLYKEVQIDFPHISAEQVQLVIYRKDSPPKKIIGLEFFASEDWGIPAGYQRVSQLGKGEQERSQERSQER